MDHEFRDTPLEQLVADVSSPEPVDRLTREWAADTGIGDQDSVYGFDVWGDAASYNTRDQLYVLLVSIATGQFHRRFIFQIRSIPRRVSNPIDVVGFSRCGWIGIDKSVIRFVDLNLRRQQLSGWI